MKNLATEKHKRDNIEQSILKQKRISVDEFHAKVKKNVFIFQLIIHHCFSGYPLIDRLNLKKNETSTNRKTQT